MSVWKPSIGKWGKGLNVLKFYDFRSVQNRNGSISYVFTFVHYKKDGAYPEVSLLRQENSPIPYIVWYFHPTKRAWDFQQNAWTSDPKNPFFIREVKNQLKLLREFLNAIAYYGALNYVQDRPLTDIDAEGIDSVAKLYRICSLIDRALKHNRALSYRVEDILKDSDLQFELKNLAGYNFPIIAYFDEQHSKSNRKKYNQEVFLCPPFNPNYGDSFPILSQEEFDYVRRNWNAELEFKRTVRGRRITTQVFHGNVLINVLTEFNMNGEKSGSFSTNVQTKKEPQQQEKTMTKGELLEKMEERNPALKNITDSEYFKPLYDPDSPVEEEDDDVPF